MGNEKNDTVEALEALIRSAGLTDEQVVTLRKALKRKRKERTQYAGLKSKFAPRVWVTVTKPNGENTSLFVGRVSDRTLVLQTTETDRTKTAASLLQWRQGRKAQ